MVGTFWTTYPLQQEKKHISLIPSSGPISRVKMPMGKTTADYFIIREIDGRKRGYENVKKWTSKVDIFSKEYIVIPVNEA